MCWVPATGMPAIKAASEETAATTAYDARAGGAGVAVTLNDSPLWETAVNNSGSTTNINDYVIHQQDVESVVNALWAGGAEAMIMDQRVLFNSAVICSGNVLSIHGKYYRAAIHHLGHRGSGLHAQGAERFEAITILKQYVTAFGIGCKWRTRTILIFRPPRPCCSS